MSRRTGFAALAAPAFWLALAGAVTLALLPNPLDLPDLSDKAQHMLAFGTLAFLGFFAFPRFPRIHLAERLSFLGALVEVLQAIPSLHRDCDIRDWIADTIAIVAVLVVMHMASPAPRKR